ncbi:MAG: hypothetical protein Q8P41_11820 [Pseudomonadota bacterium]|nr:hypothetical protein [Pseudomonadota bacterium]
MLLIALAACTFIQPTDGTYLGEVEGFTADAACEDVWGVDLAGLQAANATDVRIAEDGESMTLDGAVECTLFDTAFNCLQADEDRVPGAHIETRVTIVGEWVASFAFNSDWELLASCDGEDCGALAESCAINWTFDPTLVQ